MAAAGAKGTVTSLGSLFPAEEAQKAARRVQDAIADRGKELDRLRGFVADNSALITLVRQLPDELSHDIMVPFGSAAFFPGRLIHTNEFLVLLGEGYYAERTAKQTVEILKRRGKSLEAQVETFKATMLDLEAEAKFFDSTAAEAVDGLVEIREKYIEEPEQNEPESGLVQLNSVGSSKESSMPDEDAEYAQIMARLDELEEEEEEAEEEDEEEEEEEEEEEAAAAAAEKEEAESASGSGEDEDAEAGYSFSTSNNYAKGSDSETSAKKKLESLIQKPKDQEMLNLTTAKSIGVGSQQHLSDRSSIVDINMQIATADGSYKSYMDQSHTKQKSPLPPEPEENLKSSVPKFEDSFDSVASQNSKVGFDGRKAFTGSIIEHTYGIVPSQSTKTSTSDKPSGSDPVKPVSRFKMHRGNR